VPARMPWTARCGSVPVGASSERVSEMGERLSPLDTMFLDLEQVDDGATMHFGAIMVFDAPARRRHA